MKELIAEIRNCTACRMHLPHLPNPVIQVSPESKIAIIGQAPGRKVHESGIPWDDQSGRELRRWLGVDDEQFYNPAVFADRKSTRLNSSHVKISYAVFCLKK